MTGVHIVPGKDFEGKSIGLMDGGVYDNQGIDNAVV